ncbi:DsbA family oxidoreductase [Paenibacillus sp. YIM B09110]|uniref:DsbA family oxidoreductase n=1 Tax=Paenibacillus sp. YIM B09110 TaxID=3126102 RepID=UPI00301BB7A5
MKIDIFFDTICPWCRIGKQFMMQALESWQGEEVEVRYRAFMLDANVPLEGRDYSIVIEQFGGKARTDQMFAQVCKIGESCGLHFDFNRIGYMPNTLLSHQLIKLAPNEQKSEISDLIAKAYFEDGLDLGDLEVVVGIANTAGLDAPSIRTQLLNKATVADIEKDISFAAKAGIRSVPYFIINDRYSIQNPQSADTFLQAFKQIQLEQGASK